MTRIVSAVISASDRARMPGVFIRIISGAKIPMFLSNPGTRSFWMILKCSSIVIINLIATSSFLYHKSEKPAVTRID